MDEQYKKIVSFDFEVITVAISSYGHIQSLQKFTERLAELLSSIDQINLFVVGDRDPKGIRASGNRGGWITGAAGGPGQDEDLVLLFAELGESLCVETRGPGHPQEVAPCGKLALEAFGKLLVEHGFNGTNPLTVKLP